MPKHKRSSRSRSKSPSKSSNNYRDRSRHSQKQKHKTHHHSKNSRKRQYSSSSQHSHSSRDSYKSYQYSNQSNRQKGRGGDYAQHQQPRYKIEQTKTLKIQKCTNKQAAERALTDASITAGTSVPDQIQVKDDCVFAKYPSIEVSTKIKQLLKQAIVINGEEHRINFYPYKRIDLNMAYDWYCQNCQYKNFARRNKCYRCDFEKTSTCKLNYNTALPTSKGVSKEQKINNCSLMLRGPIMTETQEQVILQIFQAICSVKDIRMIRNKMTGLLKDFAFVEFFTPEDAALAFKQANHPDFRVSGEKVSVMYSRNKSEDDYIKPLPYQRKERRKDFNKKQKKPDEPVQSYYNKQRQLQIEQQKQRPIITIQQLKQKRQQELKKKAANARQLTQQQTKRRQAQLMAKQWQRQAKMQNTILYICVPCRRKFKGQPEMKAHQQNSKLHKYNKSKFQLSL